MNDLTPDYVLKLAETHTNRYRDMLVLANRGVSGYNIPELVYLLACWQGVRTKGGVMADLNMSEATEVRDAAYDEMDDFPEIEEITAIDPLPSV